MSECLLLAQSLENHTPASTTFPSCMHARAAPRGGCGSWCVRAAAEALPCRRHGCVELAQQGHPDPQPPAGALRVHTARPAAAAPLRGPSFAAVHETRRSGPRGCAIAARRAERICSPGPRGIWAGQPAAADGGCAEGAAPDAARARRAALPARATVMAVTAGRATRAAIWRISAVSAGAKRGGRRASRRIRSELGLRCHASHTRSRARTHTHWIH